MEEEREDGEISEAESNSCEDVDVYTPVARPVSNVFKHQSVCSPIPSSENESSSSDSDSESEYMCKPKRQKTKCVQMEVERNGQHDQDAKRKKNNIWSNVLQEEELLGIGGVGLKKVKSDRNVESYDYTRALKVYETPKEEDPFDFEETENDVQKRMTRKRRFYDNVSEAKKKGKKTNAPRHLKEIELNPEMDDEQLGRAIADALFEQKPELVVRVVQVLGQERALSLYKNTQSMEKEGGMLINNGLRRRTSGGIYLLLLKTFDGVTEEDLSKIFCEDQEEQLWRKRMKANRRRGKHKNKNRETVETINTMEEDGLNLKGLSDDPGGTKCPGSTPVTSPAASDNEESETSQSKLKGNQTLLRLKEVCEKAVSEIIRRDKSEAEEVEPGEIPAVRQEDMEIPVNRLDDMETS